MKKPNFFVVGHPKSGTTALYYFLEQHPEIYVSPMKEPHYFCKDLHEKEDLWWKKSKRKIQNKRYKFRNDKEYLKLFADVKNEKAIGEFTTPYLFSNVAAKEIKKFNPDSKIIIFLRSPVDFLKSHHQHQCLSKEPVFDFQKAIELEESRKKGKNLQGVLPPLDFVYYSDWAKYKDQVERYFKEFKKKDVMVIIYEDFKKDNMKWCKKIFKFLGLNDRFTPKLGSRNISKVIRYKRLKRLMDHPLSVSIKRKLKRITPKRIKNLYREIYTKKMYESKRFQVDKKFEERLKQKLKPEVKKISKLLKKDLLKKWNY